MKNEICMLVVTFNRKELLKRNLEAVLRQTCETDLFIFDNHSTDGTREYLEENRILPDDRIHYHYSDSNIGGAGGFSQGMKKVYKLGYRYVWLMDDDGYCWDENTLQILMDASRSVSKDFILNSTVICDENKKLTFGFLDITSYEDLTAKARDGIYSGYINPFNSTLISRECIRRIGFPRGDFFLYGDEHEYMLRALKKGIFVGTVVDSLYYHPVNREIKTKKVWKYEVPIKEEPVWKTYCDTRNSVYIMKKYHGKKMLAIRIFTAMCKGEIDGFKVTGRLPE